MRKFEIVVEQQVVDYIERLAFEVEGQKRIVKELIMENPNNPEFLDSPTFLKYQARYEEKSAEYELAKRELQETNIPSTILEHSNNVSWELDFKTSILNVTVACNCLDDVPLEVIFSGKKA